MRRTRCRARTANPDAAVDFFNGRNAVASGLRIPYEPPVFTEPKEPVA